MQRFYKLNVLIFLPVFFFCLVGAEVSSDNKIDQASFVEQASVFPQLDFNRIDQKCLYFQKLANQSKNFRKAIYAAGIVSSAGLLTYFGFKFFGKKEEFSGGANPVSTLTDATDLKSKKVLYSNFLDQCTHYIKKGAAKGVYYGISAGVVTTFLGLQAGLVSILKDKFLDLWNGQGEEKFLGIVNLLNVNIKQLSSFFESWDLLDDEDELKENYALFIDCIENLIALVTQGAVDLLPADSKTQSSILSLRVLLCARISDFSDELKQFINKKSDADKKELSQDELNIIKISFEKLVKQISRFVKTYHSALYEV